MPSMTVQSAAMRRLRRQQQDCRMRPSLAPVGGVVKKPSPAPLCQEESPARRADGDTHAPPPSSLAASIPRRAATPVSEIKKAPITFCLGTQVKVRTPTRTYITGRRLLFWLHAVVVDALEEEKDDGCVEVIYSHYEHPARNALGVVRVLKKDVKIMVPPVPAAAAAAAGSSSDITTSHSPASSSPSSQRKGRPTVAGKKPSLLKKMEEEMRSKTEAILDSW